MGRIGALDVTGDGEIGHDLGLWSAILGGAALASLWPIEPWGLVLVACGLVGFLPVGIPLFLLTPLVTYVLYPPSIKRGDEVVDWAAGELKAMGALTRREAIMAMLAVTALAAWIAGSQRIPAVTVALVVVSLMILTGVVSWADVLGHKPGWNVLVWFATLVALADGLRQVGFLTWFAQRSATALTGRARPIVNGAPVNSCLVPLAHADKPDF